ncbi:MAG: MlaE family lipid ABC transporter permease subunit [Pseudomonadota bacterium]
MLGPLWVAAPQAAPDAVAKRVFRALGKGASLIAQSRCIRGDDVSDQSAPGLALPHSSVDNMLDISAWDEGLVLRGSARLADCARLERALADLTANETHRLDLAGVTRLETAPAYLIARQRARIAAGGGRLELSGAGPEITRMIERVTPDNTGKDIAEAPRPPLAWLEDIGRAVAGSGRDMAELLGYLGLFLTRLTQSLLRPSEFRLTALVYHCHQVGLKAAPIVALMAFLIGIVLAFQGSSQLRQFGAEVFVVDLIAISILRELGILLTAIIVAGRTASAFTAAIGSMKMREEVDAMQTLGIDPAAALFVPRILALIITLPILGLVANLAGLFGGGLMSWIELGISPQMFLTRLLEGTDISHAMVGLVKAPVFALIIGLIGCRAGMAVKGNAESLGQNTSSAVVAAIFAVIVTDAIFSIFFAQIGI